MTTLSDLYLRFDALIDTAAAMLGGTLLQRDIQVSVVVDVISHASFIVETRTVDGEILTYEITAAYYQDVGVLSFCWKELQWDLQSRAILTWASPTASYTATQVTQLNAYPWHASAALDFFAPEDYPPATALHLTVRGTLSEEMFQ